MRARLHLVLLALTTSAGMAAWGTHPADAHGPCGCLGEALTAPGREVRIGTERGQPGIRGVPAYRVVFNPRPSDFGIAPRYLASAYRADAPTTTVLSRSRHKPIRNARFRVPQDTPPGLYMVIIWDGGEGGGHNTWDYLHVAAMDDEDPSGVVAVGSVEKPGTTAPPAARSEKRTRWLPVAAGVLAGLGLGLAATRRKRRAE